MYRTSPQHLPNETRSSVLGRTRTRLIAGVLAGILAGVTLVAGSVSAAIAPPTDAPKAEIQRMLVEEALIDGTVPPTLALAVARVESNFQADVTSHAGAMGVMQIMPATAQSEFGVPSSRLFDARLNSRLGIAFLHRLYTAYGQRWDLALSHYNGGSLQKVGGVWVAHSYTRDYVTKVMGFWNDFQRERWVQALITEAGDSGTTLAQVDDPVAPPRTVHEQMAEDYAYLEDPTIDRDWRDYLQVADRWLNANGGVPEAAPEADPPAVEFTDPESDNPNWHYPLATPEPPPQPTHAGPVNSRQNTQVSQVTQSRSTQNRLKGAERFIYSGEFWKSQTPRARFN